ncbi:hypothetical protein [Mycolicibacterium rhodesiae]|uniref:hypothetical protein n=1 Tax=Mycolicibacterium rhodesiae TaxID=36814 RepID=UPI0010564A18|nr:hypothetical protein [Mycolicibacterium rhodesiae]MCV7343916.1 hypothetical protein [Mycolicibacterium rhodesiae]
MYEPRKQAPQVARDLPPNASASDAYGIPSAGKAMPDALEVCGAPRDNVQFAANAPRVVFIGPERTDARCAKRIAALHDQGWKVIGCTFYRDRGEPHQPAAWDNIHLGTTYDRRHVHRVWAVIRALGIILKNRDRLLEVNVLYAINFDNALLALFVRLVCFRRVSLVVEIADIQPVMTGTGIVSRFLRSLERFVLRRSKLLVTTSPAFLRRYFEPVQRFRGSVVLLENKVYPSAALAAARKPRIGPVNNRHWTIGYFGSYRCERSIALICRLAGEFPDKLSFVLHGVPTSLDSDYFHKSVRRYPNIRYCGPYRYPDDLPAMYSSVDFNWCFDFSATGGNSTWLLPNRIYEGGLFHCPALALAGTETAAWLRSHGLGREFEEDLFESLKEFFNTLTVGAWEAMRERCEEAPDGLFTAEEDYRNWSARIELLANE